MKAKTWTIKIAFSLQDGYIYLEYGKNVCGMAKSPLYAEVWRTKINIFYAFRMLSGAILDHRNLTPWQDLRWFYMEPLFVVSQMINFASALFALKFHLLVFDFDVHGEASWYWCTVVTLVTCIKLFAVFGISVCLQPTSPIEFLIAQVTLKRNTFMLCLLVRIQCAFIGSCVVTKFTDK